MFAALVLGGVCAYQYFQLNQQCAQMANSAEDKVRTATAATGTAQASDLKKAAEDARKKSTFICEDNKSRQKNYLLAGFGALILIIIAAAFLFFSRRPRRQFE